MTTWLLNPDNEASRNSFLYDLRQALPEATTQIDDLEDFINSTVAEADKQETVATDLQIDIDRLEGELEDKDNELDDAQTKITELEEKLAELEQ